MSMYEIYNSLSTKIALSKRTKVYHMLDAAEKATQADMQLMCVLVNLNS